MLCNISTTYISICVFISEFGAEGDPKWTLHRYEAQIEARYLGNLDRSRELYEEILKSNSSRAEMWLEYVNLER